MTFKKISISFLLLMRCFYKDSTTKCSSALGLSTKLKELAFLTFQPKLLRNDLFYAFLICILWIVYISRNSIKFNSVRGSFVN